ncbi:MFS transporter, MCP family, solute carrier family 16, member 10 [Polychaeton citri CBS 116435]|uniref:MFS transporter, MCP family, solute carrier family 16, member 10 n=1 Tax=Polychaeton citri CBS 116435 TaxID=1314669 RepID=A0A9P4Q787_9PEZI|nr:MFS transporter, MCP family, solute carrier family 16, member 10 [Polychaeton citri CBS 116435]
MMSSTTIATIDTFSDAQGYSQGGRVEYIDLHPLVGPTVSQLGKDASIPGSGRSLGSAEEAQASQNVAGVEDVPPNGGYGWVCTLCVFLVNAHTWGVNSAWAIFLAHYIANDTFPGVTNFEYSLIGGLSISQALLISPLVTICNRRFGTRFTMLLGSVLQFAALFSAGSATKIWHLFLSQGVCFGWGMGFLYITATSVLPQWFSTKRSLAVGLSTSGAGLGGLAYNLGVGAGIETLGVEWSYRTIAFCALGVNAICALLLKDRNKSVKPSTAAFDWREYGNIEVVLVILWGFLTEIGYIVLLYSLPNYANSIGLTASRGSIVGAMLNLGLAIGRPIIGYCSDALGRINVAAFVTFMCGVFCLAIWVPAKSFAPLIVFALASGFCTGIFWGTVAAVTTDVVGLQRFPSAFGLVCMSLVIPTTFAEGIALQIVSASGYVPAQVFVGCMFFAGTVSTLFLRSWQIHEINKKAAHEGATLETSQGPKRSFWSRPQLLIKPKKV